MDDLKVQNEKLVSDNIALVEDNTKKDTQIFKLKEENSNIKEELNTLKKSELFLKTQLNELKISTQKQLNLLNDTLGKIKDKMNKFKSFILFKGLDNDFKEYELKQLQEQEHKQKIEQEKDFNDFLQRGELLNSIKKHLPSSQIDILDIKKYILN